MKFKVVAAFICGLFITLSVNATDLVGKIVGVADGDTVTMLIDEPSGKQTVKIRVAQIDAPEKAQPWGQKSKQELSDLVYGKTIRAQVETKDRYGRIVANLYDGDVWVNERMVATGNAWMYRQYSNSSKLAQSEANAKQKRLDLWSLPESERVPPWYWRKSEKTRSSTSEPSSDLKEGNNKLSGQCGAKRTCGQMNSCEEAKFYLVQCGVSSLDRDNDGVPCESICKR